MKITEKKLDALNRELTLEIVKDDYAEIERKTFADLRRKADFKGFRKGNVPDSLVRRVYGGQVLALNIDGFYEPLKAQIAHMQELNFIPAQQSYEPIFVNSLDELYEKMAQ